MTHDDLQALGGKWMGEEEQGVNMDGHTMTCPGCTADLLALVCQITLFARKQRKISTPRLLTHKLNSGPRRFAAIDLCGGSRSQEDNTLRGNAPLVLLNIVTGKI